MHTHEPTLSPVDLTATPRLRAGVLVVVDRLADGTAAVRLTLGGRLLRVDGASAERVPDLLRLLDGTRTVETLLAELDDVSRESVCAALDTLRRHALLEPAEPSADAVAEDAPAVARAFHDIGVPGVAVLESLRAGTATIVGSGTLAELTTRAIERIGVGTVHAVRAERPGRGADGWRAALDASHVAVVALDVDDPRFLTDFNQEALRLERPWLLVRSSGLKVRVGPMILPRQTACYACYERRLAGNATYFNDVRAVREAVMSGRAAIPAADNVVPALAALAADFASFEVFKFFGSWVAPMALQPSLAGRFVDYAMLELEGTAHRVLKLPRCPACGVRASGKPTTRAWMEPYDYRQSD